MRSVLTGSEHTTLLEEIPTSRLTDLYKSEFSVDVADEFAGVDRVFRYRCDDSGLVFFAPPSVAGSGRFYQGLEHLSFYYQESKWEYPITLADVKGCKSLLEVGCGTGQFLKIAKNAGIDVTGVELNNHAASVAAASGLAVSSRSLREVMEAGEQFDAVCSFHVLEHVPDPASFISESIAVTRPGGTIIIAVPNSQGYVGLGYDPLNYPPHHMTHWTVDVFRSLERSYPVRLEKVVVERLSKEHVGCYLAWHTKALRARHPQSRWLLNRATLPVIQALMKAGLRRMCTGHTLYLKFTKV